jgi:hypothetical protein
VEFTAQDGHEQITDFNVLATVECGVYAGKSFLRVLGRRRAG